VATTRVQIAASPDEVFAVLADPDAYGHWVVGSDTIRDADLSWPKVGSRFHHRVGFGLLKLNDHTEVIESDPPNRLVIRARTRPLATAEIRLLLIAHDHGTELTMIETAGDALSRWVFNPITDPLVHLRNVESLRRLRRMAEAEAPVRD
jgi:uncharacterized protein YndB with AHSA1/START domain